MALIRKAREIASRRPDGPGWKEARERLLAGPAQGCDRFTVRTLSLGPGGATPRTERPGSRLLQVLLGEVLLMDGDGGLTRLSTGDAAVIRPMERHHLLNESPGPARVLLVDEPR